MRNLVRYFLVGMSAGLGFRVAEKLFSADTNEILREVAFFVLIVFVILLIPKGE